MVKRLLEPILEDGIRHTHFFNGRRLAAEDLRTEQLANRRARELLGLGLGPGIVSGFEVSDESYASSNESTVAGDRRARGLNAMVTLKVNEGLAFNRLGQPVRLPSEKEVALVVGDLSAPEEAGLFSPCETPTPITIGIGSGAYILTVSPTSGFEGRVPMSDFGAEGRITGCGRRFAVEGVHFHIASLNLPVEDRDEATLRNRLAHLCFGTEEAKPSVRFPRLPARSEKARLQELAPDLRPCDVPLAIFYWTRQRIAFLDNWAVRRRVAPTHPDDWGADYVGAEKTAVAEAVFLQFQDEIDGLLCRGNDLKKLRAEDRFRYLPAAGILPVGSKEFSIESFFSPDRFPEIIELDGDPAFIREWIHRSLFVDPIDVLAAPSIAVSYIPDEEYVVFMRLERSQVRWTPKDLPTKEEPKTVGAIEVDLALAEPIDDYQGGLTKWRPSDLSKEQLRAVIDREVRLVARDEVGREQELQFVWVEHPLNVAVGKPFARYVASSLPPGRYTITVNSIGFLPASTRIELVGGDRERYLFELQREDETGFVLKPEATIDGQWTGYEGVRKIAVIDAYINPLPVPEDVHAWDVVTDPPPEIHEWLVAWGKWTGRTIHDAVIDPGDVRLVVRPDYTKDMVTDEPYAYITFGKNGTHVPVVFVPEDTALDSTVSVQRVAIPGVDEDVGMRLLELGVKELDVAGAAWTGLFKDAGLQESQVPPIREGARRKAEELAKRFREGPTP